MTKKSIKSNEKKNVQSIQQSTQNLPRLNSEAEERAFWEKHDSTPYVDWSRAQRVRLTELKPSTTAISIRLPTDLLEQIKTSANRKDIPYQSLIKLWLAEKMASQSRPLP